MKLERSNEIKSQIAELVIERTKIENELKQELHGELKSLDFLKDVKDMIDLLCEFVEKSGIKVDLSEFANHIKLLDFLRER